MQMIFAVSNAFYFLFGLNELLVWLLILYLEYLGLSDNVDSED